MFNFVFEFIVIKKRVVNFTNSLLVFIIVHGFTQDTPGDTCSVVSHYESPKTLTNSSEFIENFFRKASNELQHTLRKIP